MTSDTSQTGARIRSRRVDLGMRQSELAKLAGISPSYLNLIEHDKRRIAGRLLSDIARALKVDATALAEGARPALVESLQHAASRFSDIAAEYDKIDELATRFPGWSGLIAAQSARIAALESRAQILADRITHDPELAAALHGVISSVTAIRSTAAILTSDEKLDTEWLARFHRNIHDDAMRLAHDSEALMAYLDPPEDQSGIPLSPIEEVERRLEDTAWYLESCEKGKRPDLDGLTAPARALFSDYARQYILDAAVLPRHVLEKAAVRHAYDIWAIAAETGVAPDVVMRRIITLGRDKDHPAFGFVACDASGYATLIRQVPGFAFYRGAACPLWPVFAALGQPGRPIRMDAVMPGASGDRIRCTALSNVAFAPGDALPPVVSAMMVTQVDPAPDHSTPLPVGISCRICPRQDCSARREPSALGAGVSDGL